MHTQDERGDYGHGPYDPAEYTPLEMQEARRAILSSIGKCKKAQTKLKENSPQHKYVARQLEAFAIGVALMENTPQKEPYPAPVLISATTTYRALIHHCEKLLPKWRENSPQRTLALRRIKALQIAQALVTMEREGGQGKEKEL